MSALRPVENEKYIPKFSKHKYVSITSAADQIAAKAAQAQKPTATAKPAVKAVPKNV